MKKKTLASKTKSQKEGLRSNLNISITTYSTINLLSPKETTKIALSVPKASAKVMNEIAFCKSGCCEVACVELGLVPYGV